LLADIFENGIDGHFRVAFGWQALVQKPRLVRVSDPGEAELANMPFEELQASRWRETWHGI
jgi:hypothetical protein